MPRARDPRAPGGARRLALVPLSWVYGAGVAFARGRRVPRAGAERRPRVIAVGNLTVGGSGKTPLAMHLLERLAKAGVPAGYASRGYRSRAEHGPFPTVVPPLDASPGRLRGVRVLTRTGAGLAHEIGDEGAVVAAALPSIPLAFHAAKTRAVGALADLGAEVVVVDDAFQSWSLSRHVDVVLVDAAEAMSDRLLPAGRLRERLDALRRADVVVFAGADDPGGIERDRARMAGVLRADTLVLGVRREVRLACTTPGEAAAPVRALGVAGIAHPGRFAASAAALGLRDLDLRRYPDHHRYTAREARALREAAKDSAALVTTAKDWVKLSRFDWEGVRVWVAHLRVDLVGERIDEWLLADAKTPRT